MALSLLLSAWCCWSRAAGWGEGEGRDLVSCTGAIWRRDADVAPGDESGASRYPECLPARRSGRLHLGREVLGLARDRCPGDGTGGGACRKRHRQGRPHSRAFQELRRDVLVDVRGL